MKKRVLFLCTGNSARSQMAEALLRSQAGDNFDVFSAGTSPEDVDPQAIEALKHFKVPTDGLRSKPVSEFEGQTFDFVITLCDKAREKCKSLPNAVETLAWNFEDPKTRAGLLPFSTTLKELDERIKMFVLVQTSQKQATS